MPLSAQQAADLGLPPLPPGGVLSPDEEQAAGLPPLTHAPPDAGPPASPVVAPAASPDEMAVPATTAPSQTSVPAQSQADDEANTASAAYAAWLAHESGWSPDDAVQSIDASQTTGLSPALLADNAKDVSRAQSEQKMASDLACSPGLNDYANQSAAHATALKGDTGPMAAIGMAIALDPMRLLTSAAIVGVPMLKQKIVDADNEWEKALSESGMPFSDAVTEMQMRALRDAAANARANYLSLRAARFGDFIPKETNDAITGTLDRVKTYGGIVSPALSMASGLLSKFYADAFLNGEHPGDEKEQEQLAQPDRGMPIGDNPKGRALDKTLIGEVLTGPARSADFLGSSMIGAAAGDAIAGPPGAFAGTFGANEFSLFGPEFRQMRAATNADGSRTWTDPEARTLALTGATLSSLGMSATEMIGGNVMGMPIRILKGTGANTAEQLAMLDANKLIAESLTKYPKAVVVGNTVISMMAAMDAALDELSSWKRGDGFNPNNIGKRAATAWVDAFKLTTLMSAGEFLPNHAEPYRGEPGPSIPFKVIDALPVKNDGPHPPDSPSGAPSAVSPTAPSGADGSTPRAADVLANPGPDVLAAEATLHAAYVGEGLPRVTIGQAIRNHLESVGRLEIARRDRAQLEDSIHATEKSKLAVSSPQQVREALEMVIAAARAKDPEATARTALVDRPAFDIHFGPQEAPRAAERVDGNYEEAQATGGPVAIPIAAHLAFNGPTGDARALAPDTKLSTEGLTPREAAEEARVHGLATELERTHGDQLDHIERASVAQAVAAGRPPEEATHWASLVRGAVAFHAAMTDQEPGAAHEAMVPPELNQVGSDSTPLDGSVQRLQQPTKEEFAQMDAERNARAQQAADAELKFPVDARYRLGDHLDRDVQITDINSEEMDSAPGVMRNGQYNKVELVKWLKAKLKNVDPDGKGVLNEHTGARIKFNADGSQKAVFSNDDPLTHQVLAALPELLQRAVLGHEAQPNRDSEKAPNVRDVLHFYAPARIGDQMVGVRMVVRRLHDGGIRSYQVVATKVENIPGVHLSRTSEVASADALGPPGTMKVSELAQQVKPPKGLKFNLDPTPRAQILKQSAAQERGHIVLVRNADGTKSYKIHIGPNADASTLFHETGHWLVDTNSEAALKPGAHPQLRADMDALMKWAGYAGGVEDRAKGVVEANEEKITKAWEQYGMEGKAPTPALQRAFAWFSEQMKKIYGTIKGHLTDEVRDIFGRMVGGPDVAGERKALTEQVRSEIHEDPAGRAMHALQDSTDAGQKLDRTFVQQHMGPAISDRLDKLGVLGQNAEQPNDLANRLGFANAHEMAHAMLAMPSAKEQAAEVQRRLEENHPELARTEVAQTMRANIEAAHSAPEMENVLREINQMSQQLGNKARYAPRSAVTEAGKRMARPDLFPPAHYEGLEREAEARARAAEARGDDAAAKAARDAREAAAASRKVAEEHEEQQRKEQARAQREDEAAHKRLLSGAIERPGELEMYDVQHEAEQLVGDKALGDIDPTYYLTAERAAASKAARHVLQGDIQGAINAKKQQLLNMFAWRAARDTRKELDATKSKVFGDYKQPNRQKWAMAGQAYLDGIDATMEAIGAKGLRADEPPPIDATMNRMDIDGYPRAPGVETALRDVTANPRPWNKLKPDEARTIAAGILNIKLAAKAVLNIDTGREKLAFTDAVARSLDETKNVHAIAPTVQTSGQKLSGVQQARTRMNSISLALNRFLTNIEPLGGTAKAILYDSMIDCRNQKEDLVAEIAPFIKQNWEKVPASIRSRAFESTNVAKWFPMPRIDEGGRERRPLTDVPRTWLYSLFLHDGSNGNMQRFLGGPTTLVDGEKTRASRAAGTIKTNEFEYGKEWSQDDVNDVLYKNPATRITREEADFLQGVTDKLTSTFWQRIADKQRERTGMEPPKVAGVKRTITFADGTSKEYAGGYHPLAEDKGIEVDRTEPLTSVQSAFGKQYQFASTAAGHTESRIEGARYMVDMNWDSIPNHITQVAHDLAFGDWVRAASRFALKREFAANAERVIGKARADGIMEQIRTIATQQAGSIVKSTEGVQKAIMWSKNVQVARIVGYSIPLALGQLSHLPGMMVGGKVSLVHGAAAAAKLLIPGAPEFMGGDGFLKFPNIQAAQAASHALRHRLASSESMVAENVRQVFGSERQGIKKVLKPVDYARAHAGIFLHLVDSYTSAWAFIAARASAIDKGMSDEAAERHADDVVREVMPDHSIETAAPILNHTLGGFLIMHGFGSTLYNMAVRDVVQPFTEAAHKGDVAGMGKAGLRGIQHAAMLATLGIVGKLLMGHGPEQDESLGAWMTRNAISAPGLLLPWLGGAAEYAAGKISQELPDWWTQDNEGRGATGHIRFDEQAAPGLALAQNIHELGTHLGSEKREPDQKLIDLLSTGMALCRMPSVPLAKQGSYMNNVTQGRMNPRASATMPPVSLATARVQPQSAIFPP